MPFPSISPKQSFPALESEILAYWKANNTFKKSIESRPEDNPYRFYDGPPFITGTPHYGSLLSSIVKDVVGRYWTMRGKRVDRVWGWDCHGLPIEEKVQKKLGLKSNREIEEHGVKSFIDGCYEYTQSTSAEWDWYIDKIGRWVDMDRAYRTMDQDYMESVMWVFKQLWDKGLIYEGKRVSLYSWKLSTPISNFEVAMDDTYQDVNDPAITVKFRLEANDKFPENTSILAWTTTPWTIPANMALGIGEKITYVLVENNGENYIVAATRAETVFKGKGEYTVVREFSGADLVGLSYIPPFPEYYKNKWDALSPEGVQSEILKHLTNSKAYFDGLKEGRLRTYHKVYAADFATDTDGTGIVHIAPEFGDVDFGLAKKYGIPVTEAMDEAGKYTAEIFDYEGTHYLDLENPEKGANKINIERMKANNTLFKLEGITHRVPFCPRSGTPLMQRAQSSWFIDIQSQKDKLLEANKQINWFPEYLKEGRFAKGIESAPDWCISRTRFWGAPMPVWMGEDGEQLVIGSREEIFELNKPFGQLTKLIITRHAESVANVEKHYDDTGDSPLSENGKRQAEELMAELKDKGIDIIITSPFLRAIQTAEPLAKELGIKIITDDRLKETDHGKFANADYNNENTRKLVREQRDRIFTDKSVKFGETGESYTDVEMRVKTVIEEICEKYPGKTVFIVSHGFPVRIATEYLTGKRASETTKNADARTFILDVTNKNLLNLHRPYIDAIKLKSPKTGNTLTRIPEVLDVWMDSGSMPYAQMHYPFENKGEMEASFPADFIAEYVGQVRAWFYVMHVLGVLLNPNNEPTPTPSFTNVITTGVINGNDGRKMSKSYGNYPDPRATIEKYGADPIRFYMLNSPLLSGGDMDFKEEGIMETIKGVMLPIWNTYSFFTTYANIDGWTQDETEIWFTRHAESESNVIQKMSDGTDDPKLTEKGREQAKNAGEKLREQGKNFDVIIYTDRVRTYDTARIIGTEIGFIGEYIVHDGFAEQSAGEYANKTLQEIATMKGLPTDTSHVELRKIYKNNSAENLEQFEKRILAAYEDVLAKYKGKRVLIIAHAGTPRPILANYMGMDKETANYNTTIHNADPFRLATTKIVNPLDRWILSKLQVLIGQVHDAMEGYDISRACRAIVDYMDELTNWYVRLSRRRFWGSDMTDDKKSGYETLHTVLVEVSKLLAPYMPFLAESIFQGLTRKESVHLEYVTFPNRHLISSDLNRDMEICEHIVSLGLALRSRKNIRVRQPLQSVTITQELDEYYQSIIRDELNVKEVRFENPERLAKKICKPDARKIGPKYGKDVQKVIMEAKNGNFVEKENGIVDVSGFILERGEYTMEYLPLEGVGDVEGGYGMVISLDMNITESLKLEGYARDLIRAIQEMRKEADYQVTDRISLHIFGEKHEEILASFGEMIQSETLATIAPLMVNPDLQKEVEIDEGITLTIQIEK
ncbi:MAG: class I tRNA ligase family protein [Candidatus Gracilibacteria bacterium]|nr:class I tRNA ligase family protein [Candidatus Gracilibacteria bacterium]